MGTLMRMLTVCCFCAVVSCAPPTAIFTVPEKKDVSLLTAGTPRERLIQEFGPPAGTYTDRDTGALHDVFRFQQGYSRGARWGMLAGNPGGHVHYRCWSRTLGHEYGGECEI